MIFKDSLFAFDVDGTLLNSHGELTRRTIAAIATASDQGATIALATGRSWSELDRVMEAIPEIELRFAQMGWKPMTELVNVYTQRKYPRISYGIS
ncbi:MAG: hypothetical protein CM15mP49_32780 [Actinomycetota bacterium]|nr:MAG: hypothetical protein CM15mP49_32780 [Actinomycetota bacterium]